MQQLAFSIDQAREFFKSAETSGPSTRALMAYYGATSLANAEILWRGTGKDSLDARPDRFNSHGFSISRANNLLDFMAKPVINHGAIGGLFGLWRNYAEHIPLFGESTFYNSDNASSTNVKIMTGIIKLTEFVVPVGGVSLGASLACLPSMQGSLRGTDYEPQLRRGTISEWLRKDQNDRYVGRRSYSFHHLAEPFLTEIGGRFEIDPRLYEDFQIESVGSGLIVNWHIYPDDQDDKRSALRAPEIFAKSSQDVYFIGNGEFLNEFGHYYAGLYVAGMITRYYPHLWVKEIRASSTAAILVDELVDHALERLPLLTAGALDRVIFLYD